MILLDTDILSIIQVGRGQSYDRLISRLNGSSIRPVAVSIVSFEEQMRGWLAYAAKSTTVAMYVRAMSKLHEMIDDFRHRTIVDFDAPGAAEFQRLKNLKLRIGTMDLRIAAIALANSALLITRNLVDFRRVPGLTAEDWTR